MKRIQKQWDMFNAAVMPPDAPDVQRREMRRAFYAGAEAMMRINWELGGNDISENEAMKALDGINAEMLEFSKQIATGKA